MAQHTTLAIPADAWTLLTDSDVTSVTFQNQGRSYIMVKPTAGAVAPTTELGALRYNPGQGERNVAMSDLAPGIAANRLYVYGREAVTVFVSHG